MACKIEMSGATVSQEGDIRHRRSRDERGVDLFDDPASVGEVVDLAEMIGRFLPVPGPLIPRDPTRLSPMSILVYGVRTGQ